MDIIQERHINILNESKKLGIVIVDVLSDSVMIRFNRFSRETTEERMKMLEELPGIERAIIQNTIMYNEVIEKWHPNYIVHGNNWMDPGMDIIR